MSYQKKSIIHTTSVCFRSILVDLQSIDGKFSKRFCKRLLETCSHIQINKLMKKQSFAFTCSFKTHQNSVPAIIIQIFIAIFGWIAVHVELSQCYAQLLSICITVHSNIFEFNRVYMRTRYFALQGYVYK